MSEVIKTYKGTDKNMKCRGYQYELGRKEVDTGAIRCGDKGFHACEAPLDVLRYYPLKNGNRYFESESGGIIDRMNADDSKISSSELTLKAEIGLPGLIKAHLSYTRKKAEIGTAGGDLSNLSGGDGSNLAGGDRSNLAGGDGSNLAGGNCSNLAGGNCSNLAGGDWSNLAGGKSSIMVGRDGCKANGGLHSVIVLTEWEWIGEEYVPVCVKAEVVDGERIKANTYYRLKDGEFEEIEE